MRWSRERDHVDTKSTLPVAQSSCTNNRKSINFLMATFIIETSHFPGNGPAVISQITRLSKDRLLFSAKLQKNFKITFDSKKKAKNFLVKTFWLANNPVQEQGQACHFDS